MTSPEICTLFCQLFDCNFFEEHNVMLTVVLKAEVTFYGSQTAKWFVVKFSRRHSVTFVEISDLCAVEKYDGVRTIQGDFHRVPFRPGFAGPGQSFG